MKRAGYIYSKICDINNIENAIVNASKGKRHQLRVKEVLENKTKYAKKLSEMFENKTYIPSPYITVKLLDGSNKKERVISKPRFFPDQVAHWALMLQIEHILMKGMYDYNCGSVPKRGSSKGQKSVRKWLDNDVKCTKYCLKMDIKKFYPSINNEALKEMLRTKIKDKDCLWLIDTIIDSADGMPIGNYTSQWFANFYLQGLDHFIKGLPGVKYYVRYVDDLVIFGPNKKALHKARIRIDTYLKSISLKVKEDWQVFKVDSRPVDFLGYKFYRTHTTLRARTSLRIKRRAIKIHKKGYMDFRDACCLVSYWGWIKRSNSFMFYNKNIKPYAPVDKARKVVSKHAKRICVRTDTRV